MIEPRPQLLLAPALSNSSCWRGLPGAGGGGGFEARWQSPGVLELLRAAVILALSLGILVANLLVICVINSRRYHKYIHAQPRYLLTSLASNDLAIGLLVTPFGFVPAIYSCWPYGEIVCQIQGCVAIMSTTWIASVAMFGSLVLPKGGYYFNDTGLLACEPFFAKASIRILVCCCFYFPTTMALMYFYGSAFHMNKLRFKRVVCANTSEIISTGSNNSASGLPGQHHEKLILHERRLSTAASRTMAAMSLGFIVMVTPWTIQEVVAACTGTKPPAFLDFIATWLALSNSFWNPFLYWLLNNHFRRISREIYFTRRENTNCERESESGIPLQRISSSRARSKSLIVRRYLHKQESRIHSRIIDLNVDLCLSINGTRSRGPTGVLSWNYKKKYSHINRNS
ncbi:unnamed protein product [Trichogramma brassicae]|uniref:G-protein coupled receptors family 1 profile domain-containing protein n=1 Tax=Trichogramma brassicae TaxID=86971 RepID=A0A6H5I1K6_9HYME|nr:unnamed protein product [Trichogramma brassicae]